MDPGLFHINQRLGGLPHGVDVEGQPVSGPAAVHMAGPARDMIPELVDIVRDPAPRFIAAQLMRQIDVDWPLHR